MKTRTVGNPRDIAVADGTLNNVCGVPSFDSLDGLAVHPITDDRGALASTPKLNFTGAVSLQDVRNIASVSLRSLGGALTFGSPPSHDRRIDRIHLVEHLDDRQHLHGLRCSGIDRLHHLNEPQSRLEG